jgi:hypothetical protein
MTSAQSMEYSPPMPPSGQFLTKGPKMAGSVEPAIFV